MFTGLIETTGTILGIEERPGASRITVEAPGLADRLKTGDSIAVSGVCLTALDIEAPIFHADLAAETMARTSLTALQPGTKVNLELPTPAGAPLGGHIVQGHVDTTGKMLRLEPMTPNAEQTDWWLEIEVPESIRPFMVEKGSVAIEGISLTIARWDGKKLGVAVIPHTYAATNLHTLKPGSPVNLEADVLIKHAAQQRQHPEAAFELTLDYLVANGY
ncbi:riboflavin synthase [Silvibacterium bohemicum]|uniref:Riboflavin synthase n=1 Tax=Silvibacterium bohemicum TaxID=1577686 RepID=A0A841JLE7_9BACT|nr:riboflavin synthase [Silvibacterium bohemicum]MBB6142182.1 riboflavin synthase [Silvibacterium bohemicum]